MPIRYNPQIAIKIPEGPLTLVEVQQATAPAIPVTSTALAWPKELRPALVLSDMPLGIGTG